MFILALVLLLTVSLSKVTQSQEIGTDEQKQVVRKVAQKWIQDGIEQYNRGYFKASEQSLLRAQEYQGYLSDAERKKLNELIEQTHLAVLERQRILQHIQAADKLVQQGELEKAKVHLEKVKDSKFLTAAENKQITEGLKKLDTTTIAKAKAEKSPTDKEPTAESKQIVELYTRSVSLYRAGEFDKALAGFNAVSKSGLLIAPAGQTPEDYIKLINQKIKVKSENLRKAPDTIQVQVKPQEQIIVQPASTIEPVSDAGNSFIQKVTRKREIRRSYTKMVVSDANSKAHSFISQNEFNKANEVVETARRTVYGNQLDLGELLFKQYDTELTKLSDEIALQEKESADRLEEQKRIDAKEAAKKIKTQMEDDRNRRIKELMANTMTLQQEMRYEEALGQLESLLALDPMNNNALILKQTLEDTVNFRKQLEVEREQNRERAKILTETD
ncbi:MAG: hypothetical protein ACYS32_12695, partial [Planctomycetota bacterium]